MKHIHKTALVPYSTELMLDLIADVEQYPQFLTWCTDASVLKEDGNINEAQLVISVAGVKQRFSTRNTLGEFSLEMQLIKGPFKQLSGFWQCHQLGELGCKVELKLDFDFASGILNHAFAKGFGVVAARLLSDFCQRADKLYGS